MNTYEALIDRIADEIEVRDLKTFHHRELGSLTPAREMDIDRRPSVLRHLWRVVYLHYYVGDTRAATVLINGGTQVLSLPDREDARFADRLVRAHAARWTESTGWTLVGPAHDRASEVLVFRDGITLTVRDEEIRGGVPRTGARPLTLLMPPVQRYAYPGWCVVVGEREWRTAALGPVTRLYYAVSTPDHAVTALAAVSAALVAEGVPFQVKVVNNAPAFDRRDPFVVYLPTSVWERLRETFEHLYGALAPLLRDTGPVLARELRTGWWTADEPDTGGAPMSFGQHRCLLIAEGLVEAHVTGHNTPAGRAEGIRRRLRAAGVDPAAPYRQHRPDSAGCAVNGGART